MLFFFFLDWKLFLFPFFLYFFAYFSWVTGIFIANLLGLNITWGYQLYIANIFLCAFVLTSFVVFLILKNLYFMQNPYSLIL